MIILAKSGCTSSREDQDSIENQVRAKGVDPYEKVSDSLSRGPHVRGGSFPIHCSGSTDFHRY